MKNSGRVLIAVGLVLLAWSVYIFVKYLGLGGDNSYTPYTGLAGLVIVVIGIKLLKK